MTTTREAFLDATRDALALVFTMDDEVEALEALAELADDLADLIDEVVAEGVT